MKDFPSRFDFVSDEPKIYRQWLNSGGFGAKSGAAPDKSRCILMPPPNANAPVHIGHAYEVAIQDTLIRAWRMRGYNTLWQPGVDHAGFETQVVFEKKLEKEGRTRFGMDRDELYREIFQFSKDNQKTIRHQLERLGASCDWDRMVFMLDEPQVKTVYETFKKLHDDGLVYRAKRPVHWCVKHQTTLSDLEVRDEERSDPLYYIKYGPLTLATVRPETKFGDTAVAVHPDDKRYQRYVGSKINIETVLGPATLEVIADPFVNPDFGTGVVKVTPAHDPNDFAIAARHNLPLKVVIDERGRLNHHAGPYAGLKISEARQKIVGDLQAKGLIEKIDESYRHTVKVCYKCATTIEPRVLDQWWLALTRPGHSGKCLRDLAVAAVESQETKFVTKRFENQFFSWMQDLKDWPLSRQIAWGIRLPVFYCQQPSAVSDQRSGEKLKSESWLLNASCPPIITNGETPQKCPTCGGTQIVQDSDVFDTWFSSCQWPFSTLGNHGDDLKTFYPTTVMAPGYDIVFFWVARMMMLSIYITGQTPFQTILLHGLVRDKDRQKMSKSKGNVVDPLGVAEQYGADAVRLALLHGAAPGTDPVISEEKIRGMRNFTTKLWNIARFVAMSTSGQPPAKPTPSNQPDRDILEKLEVVTRDINRAVDRFRLHHALEALYQFIWRDLADVYIESAKTQLADELSAGATKSVLRHVMARTLWLAHPFAPFTTEALWRELGFSGCLMTTREPA